MAARPGESIVAHRDLSAKTLGDNVDRPLADPLQQWVDGANTAWDDMDGILAVTRIIVGNYRHAEEVNLRMW
ncbi:hypothetical protein [Gordonia sp. NPDC003422]